MLFSGSDVNLVHAPDVYILIMIFSVVLNYTNLKYFIYTSNRDYCTVFVISYNFCDNAIFLIIFHSTKIVKFLIRV
jgi:hypothetical protein